MVKMIGRLNFQLLGLFLFPILGQLLNLGMVAQFHLIPFVHLKVWCILHPNIDAIGLLA